MFALAPDLNRSVAFVRVLEPFAAWARLDPDFSHVTVESLNSEGTAYLLPDVVWAGDEEKLFRKYWRDIFDHKDQSTTTAANKPLQRRWPAALPRPSALPSAAWATLLKRGPVRRRHDVVYGPVRLDVVPFSVEILGAILP